MLLSNTVVLLRLVGHHRPLNAELHRDERGGGGGESSAVGQKPSFTSLF